MSLTTLDLAGRRARTLPEILLEAEARNPESHALCFHDRVLTYHDVREGVGRLANALAGLGVGRGKCVAIALGNTPGFVLAYYAVTSLGAIAVPFNPEAPASVLDFVLRHTAAVALIATTRLVDDMRSAGVPLPGPGRVVLLFNEFEQPGEGASLAVLDDATSVREATWHPLADLAPRDGQPSVSPDDDAAIFFTSGTTGRPKGVLMTHSQALTGIDCWASCWKWNERTISMMVAPTAHVGFHPMVLGTHRRGGAAVLLDRLTVRSAFLEVERRRVNALFCNPSVWTQFLRDRRSRERDLSSVETVLYGAASMPAAAVLELQDSFPDARLYNCYGQTETCGAISFLGPDSIRSHAGSIGIPHPPVEVRILDASGAPVPDGEPGEICCRGENVMKGYFRAPDETRRRFHGDWLRTGDIGYSATDGFLYVLDRLDDLIMISGVKIYPREVENVLMEHPEIAEVAVVGVANERKGHVVMAFVVPTRGARLKEADLRHFCSHRLAPLCVPKLIRIVETLPRNHAGKVVRSALAHAGAVSTELAVGTRRSVAPGGDRAAE